MVVSLSSYVFRVSILLVLKGEQEQEHVNRTVTLFTKLCL